MTVEADQIDAAGRPSTFLDRYRLGEELGIAVERLPRSLFIMLENCVAHGRNTAPVRQAFRDWLANRSPGEEVPFQPTRILMQDTAGVAALADIAALADLRQDAARFPFAVPVDLVVDHSVNVDVTHGKLVPSRNLDLEIARNRERYRFFKWAEQAFNGLRLVPPGNGICHQINLERLTRVCIPSASWPGLVIGECVVGTDSHTTMVNALGVLGWGVGGIEAEAAVLGDVLQMQLPRVTAVRLTGRRPIGTTSTDITLAIVHMLRAHGVVGHFVEFCGPALDNLALADRASIANMAPEYGATCGFFPVDQNTLDYLRFFGTPSDHVDLVERYARTTGLWRVDVEDRTYSEMLEFPLDKVIPAMAGPKRPDQHVALADVPASFAEGNPRIGTSPIRDISTHGAIGIAAITSCTNTANFSLLVAAGLLARKARERGLSPSPWVKTSLSPGSITVAQMVAEAGLQDDLDAMGFGVTGFGCMTCVGNSGALLPITGDAAASGVELCAVLSGNRNFEGRIHPAIRSAYLASPPLVIASAIAGHIGVDLSTDSLGTGHDGRPVYLRDIWPREEEIDDLTGQLQARGSGTEEWLVTPSQWAKIDAPLTPLFPWDPASTYLKPPPFFDLPERDCLSDVSDARALLVLGDNITTDHISPISRIGAGTAAALALTSAGVGRGDLGTYGERRANHEVMVRGTFAHPQIVNRLAEGTVGPVTRILKQDAAIPIFDAAMKLAKQGLPSVVFAGRNYGCGSARDWAAKGTMLLGVRVVVANSFERIHRTNLVAVGVVPLEIHEDPASLGITQSTRIAIAGLSEARSPRANVFILLDDGHGAVRRIEALCRVDTATEFQQMRAGGLFAALRKATLGGRERAS